MKQFLKNIPPHSLIHWSAYTLLVGMLPVLIKIIIVFFCEVSISIEDFASELFFFSLLVSINGHQKLDEIKESCLAQSKEVEKKLKPLFVFLRMLLTFFLIIITIFYLLLVLKNYSVIQKLQSTALMIMSIFLTICCVVIDLTLLSLSGGNSE